MRQSDNGAVVFRGKLSKPVDDADSGDRVQAADFSEWNKTGSYYVEVANVGRSWDFAIGPNVYARAFYLTMRAFYGQRCGTAVDLGSEFPGFKSYASNEIAINWNAPLVFLLAGLLPDR